MRYLYFLFFLFFGLHSYMVFAQEGGSTPSCTQAITNFNACGFWPGQGTGMLAAGFQSCANAGGYAVVDSQCAPDSPGKGGSGYVCYKECTCPEGQVLNTVIDNNGHSPTTCIDEPTGGCPSGDCPPEDPPCPSGFPRVDGQCPICVNGYNENGTCADDESGSSSSASSPPSSSPSSTPSSESPPPENPGGGDDDGSSSSTGGGDDGNGSPGTGGGTPGGGDGGNTGGGSASSASSTAGGAGGSSGSNNSWTPHAGYGNWIPISENSPCPNKYQDNTGQWWCAGGGGSGEIPGAGQCDPTSPNYMACITQDANSGASSSACSPSSPDYLECSGKLESAQGEITGHADSFIETIDEKTEEYKNALTEDLDNFSNEGVSFKDEPGILRSALTSLLPVSTSCNPPDIRWNGRNYELSCTYFDAFKQAVGWFLAILLAWNIYQLAIRPVDR